LLTGSTSSNPSGSAIRRPSIDELIAVAQAAGRANASRRTIRHWVEQGFVDGAVCSGTDPRYPLRAVGQVDTVARFSIRQHGIDMVRFALFIETDSVPVEQALRIATARIDALRAAAAQAKEQLATDPNALREEIERGARLRAANSVLPREVRMSLQEREQALAQLVGAALGASCGGGPDSLVSLERALGLRSGRGGLSRTTPLALTPKDIAAMNPDVMHEALVNATPVRARIARDLVEMLCVWFPALVPGLLATASGVDYKFLQVVQSRRSEQTPDAYLAAFVGALATQRQLPDDQLRDVEEALQPVRAIVELLASQPPADLPQVLSRLRPLQRLKLESALALARPTQPSGRLP
jgi:hypothetical protein